MTTTC